MQRVRITMIPLIAFALLSAAGAQSAVPPAPVELGMEVRVPLILRVSVGGSWETVLRLSGFIGAQGQAGRSFAIAPLAIADLGTIRIFSNCEGPYALSIMSRGGGFLGNDRADGLIPYSLILNGTRLSPREGVFTYDMAGKSSGGGTSFDLKLAFDDFSETLPQGFYDDKLTFLIAAR